MKVIIRCDSSMQIGTGHVARCLVLANALRNRGITPIFACRVLEGNITSLIEEKQFKVIKLNAPKTVTCESDMYAKWRGIPLHEEISEMSEIVLSEKPSWVIVDHYALPEEWEQKIRKLGCKLFVIDDIFRKHSCDAFLDQNFHPDHSSKYENLLPKQSTNFLGPSYCLLSDSFKEININARDYHRISRVLVFFGGTDLVEETVKFLKFAKKKPDFEFHIVMGKNAASLKKVQNLCLTNKNFKLHIQTSQMATIMNESDFFVGAGGTITWERCYLGLPGICITTADNQKLVAKHLHDAGVHLYLGHWNEVVEHDYERAFNLMTSNLELRKEFSEKSFKLNIGKNLDQILSLISC